MAAKKSLLNRKQPPPRNQPIPYIVFADINGERKWDVCHALSKKDAAEHLIEELNKRFPGADVSDVSVIEAGSVVVFPLARKLVLAAV